MMAVLAVAELTRLDAAVGGAAQAAPGGTLASVSAAITLLGGSEAALLLTALSAACLLMLRCPRPALAVAASVGITQLLVWAIKQATERPRPAANEQLAQAQGFSFPSGHSATSAALFGVLALIAAGRLDGAPRTVAIAAGASLIVAVGATRVVLGAHYPTDVLIGWLLGGFVAAGSLLLLARPRVSARV